MRVPGLAVVEQDGQTPKDPEIPDQRFDEDRWIRHMPRLVSLERQLSVPLAEGLRRLEPAQADVLAPVMPELGIKSRQFPDAAPHSRAERRCVRMGFAKKRN